PGRSGTGGTRCRALGRRQRLLPADQLPDLQPQRRYRRHQRHPRHAGGGVQLSLLHRIHGRRPKTAHRGDPRQTRPGLEHRLGAVRPALSYRTRRATRRRRCGHPQGDRARNLTFHQRRHVRRPFYRDPGHSGGGAWPGQRHDSPGRRAHPCQRSRPADRYLLPDSGEPARMLICPICRGDLHKVDNCVACPPNHPFDRARQGYLNLLPVQHKNSRDPGDNQAMVEARRRFLDGGHYAPLAERLAQLAAERSPSRWLDIGCGEGYYTAQLAQALPDAEGYALDISREAVKRACKRAPQLEWLVASMARVPLADASCDLLASVFSPLDWTEARRLLAPGGGLLRMGPTREHLWELRGLLYDEIRD